MTKRAGDLAKRETGSVTSGTGQVTRPAGRAAPAHGGAVVDRVVPARLARRVGARARAGEHDAWPAVVAIALGSFALVFSEWAAVPLPEPDEGQIRIKVQAAGISPTDLALRAGYLKDIPLPPDALLGSEAAVAVLRQLNVKPGETLLLFGDGGSVGVIATQAAEAHHRLETGTVHQRIILTL